MNNRNFAVAWDNECGYGTDYFDSKEDADKFIKECTNKGTNAYHIHIQAASE